MLLDYAGLVLIHMSHVMKSSAKKPANKNNCMNRKIVRFLSPNFISRQHLWRKNCLSVFDLSLDNLTAVAEFAA